MPYDQTRDKRVGVAGPYGSAKRNALVVPSNDTDFTEYPAALYVADGGDVNLIGKHNADNEAVVWTVPAGGYILLEVRRVLVTGTTATKIIALF